MNRNCKFSFSNINLIGPCNANCFFCIGKKVKNYINDDFLKIHFTKWKNLKDFLQICKKNEVQKIYLTGLNTDPTMYKWLKELIIYLKNENFLVGLRTNGFLAASNIDVINEVNDEVSYSIHSLNIKTNFKILGIKKHINWDYIFKNTLAKYRVSIVCNTYNKSEILDIVKYLSVYDVNYIQIRKISEDFKNEYPEHLKTFDELAKQIEKNYELVDVYEKSKIFKIHNKFVSLWDTANTSINSMNYFSDGTIFEQYHITKNYIESKFSHPQTQEKRV